MSVSRKKGRLKIVFFTLTATGELTPEQKKLFVEHGSDNNDDSGKPVGVEVVLAEEEIVEWQYPITSYVKKEVEKTAIIDLKFFKIPVRYTSTVEEVVEQIVDKKAFRLVNVASAVSFLSPGDVFSILTGKVQALTLLLEKKNMPHKKKFSEEEKAFLEETLAFYQKKLDDRLDALGRFVVIDRTCNKSASFKTKEEMKKHVEEMFLSRYVEITPEEKEVAKTPEEVKTLIDQKRAKLYIVFENTEYGRDLYKYVAN